MENVVYLIDCMEYMKGIPDRYFDIAIVDPPYFSGPEKKRYYGNSTGKSKHSKTQAPQTVKRRTYEPLEDSWEVPDEAYFDELRRISREQIIFGINYFTHLSYVPGRIVWYKCNEYSSYSDAEIALCTFHTSVRLFEYMWNGMMQGRSLEEGRVQQGDKRKNEERIHPTQKPLALYRWILLHYALPGFKVFDSHAGSGSLRLVCYDLSLHFEGCEKDEGYWKAQEERYRKYISQKQLFTGEELQSEIYRKRYREDGTD